MNIAVFIVPALHGARGQRVSKGGICVGEHIYLLSDLFKTSEYLRILAKVLIKLLRNIESFLYIFTTQAQLRQVIEIHSA